MAQQEKDGRDTGNRAAACGDGAKRPYVRPSVVYFGSVATLTAGVSLAIGESGDPLNRGSESELP